MKLKAKYIKKGANPFLPDWRAFAAQFREISTPELPDDSDMALMEKYAREKTPEGFDFVGIEKIK